MTVPQLPARRILFVHAHPDDETVGTGATIAKYAADEATHVTVVTCTLGEEGEIHVPELAGLAADQADQLGGYRLTELSQACEALGVTDHRYLGGAGRYRDSGMMGLATNDNPRCFWQADVDAAAALLVEVIREIRPQVLVTYDPNGFYGHPDHIQVHRVSARAAELADAEGIGPAKVYWGAIPLSVLRAGMEDFNASTDNPFGEVTTVEDLPFGTPDEEVTTRIEATAQADAKMGAVRAHATQIPPTNWLYSVAGNMGAEVLGVEYYQLASGQRGPGSGPYQWENDLFAGIDVSDGVGPAGAPVVPA